MKALLKFSLCILGSGFTLHVNTHIDEVLLDAQEHRSICSGNEQQVV